MVLLSYSAAIQDQIGLARIYDNFYTVPKLKTCDSQWGGESGNRGRGYGREQGQGEWWGTGAGIVGNRGRG